MSRDIEAWEDEGGAAPGPLDVPAAWMSVAASQVELGRAQFIVLGPADQGS